MQKFTTITCTLTIFWLLYMAGSSCSTAIQYPPGGYDYPPSLKDIDTNFYYYPLKDHMSRRDSFRSVFSYLGFRAYGERNLSLKPLPQETYRLTYATAFGNTAILTLTEEWLTVKRGNNDDLLADEDSLLDRLTSAEVTHFRLLRVWFPLDEVSADKPRIKKRIDSMVTLYPQLLDVKYYLSLQKRLIKPRDNRFDYKLTKLKITSQQFYAFVKALNRSGYWSMPYLTECKHPGTDGFVFGLEANTRRKYNQTLVVGCPGDTTAFTKLCQQLIDQAGLKKEISLQFE